MFADSVMPVLLQAAVFVRENKAVRAEEVLGQFAEKFPDKSKVVLLATAQVAAAAGHPQIAAESLAKMKLQSGTLSSINMKTVTSLAEAFLMHPEEHMAWLNKINNDFQLLKTHLL
ncbi:hypothetical protein ACB098_03G064400 [Castanea mollissima]